MQNDNLESVSSVPEKSANTVRLMCIGDLVGRAARSLLGNHLSFLKHFYGIDFVIANGENIAGGSGITAQAYDKLKKYGIDVVTLGDHCFKKRDSYSLLESKDDIIRPANLPTSAIGRGYTIKLTNDGKRVAVIVVAGRIFMKPVFDCPFHTVKSLIDKVRSGVDFIVVEIHGEATSEKIAMGWFLDGEVSLVYGTHTHIPTADGRILPNGTGYITDIGMTGPYDSVLGRKKEKILKTFINGMPETYDLADGDVRLGAIIADLDNHSARCVGLYQLFLPEAHIVRLRSQVQVEHP